MYMSKQKGGKDLLKVDMAFQVSDRITQKYKYYNVELFRIWSQYYLKRLGSPLGLHFPPTIQRSCTSGYLQL